MCILAEDYSVFDAKVLTVSHQKKEGKAHAVACNFAGVCPFHGYKHSANKWSLINTVGFNTTMFHCHHDETKRVICHRLPIPVEEE